MKGLVLSFGLAVLACLTMSGMAQEDTASEAPETLYSFQIVNFPGDTFTQLLGINNAETIAGYHGDGLTAATPNKGFTLTLPHTFTPENFPGSQQTQVIGINNTATGPRTVGFYITGGVTHGFSKAHGTFSTVDFPGTTFNQLLGVNDLDQAAGYWADSMGNFHGFIDNGGSVGATLSPRVFLVLNIPLNASTMASAQATGINNKGWLTGFYIDTKGVTHGFVLIGGTFTTINYPGATSTAVNGSNNVGQLVGTYTDPAMKVHGFVYKGGTFQTVDSPEGHGATILNGINDHGVIVGFFGACTTTPATATTCEGLVATP